jgi:hypothetical protein
MTQSGLHRFQAWVCGVFIYEIPISRLATPPRFLMAFSPCQQRYKRILEKIAMANRPMTHMDDGSRGGRNSVLLFGVVAATLTVLLILIGVAGKNVAPNTPLANIVAGNQRFAESVKITNLRHHASSSLAPAEPSAGRWRPRHSRGAPTE